ncbi:MAG TPA: enoyl-CoA hydratase-related protein [Candidatus Micrarchaeaceae archaeon]|nr:enoyl-CoA hydratase-related protein [Candidatus Micrarchaeaceae archaeon]
MGRETSKSVLLRRSGAVIELVLNRPERLNAIDDEVAADLLEGLESVAGEPGCRCLVITGSGRGFCSGQALPSAQSGSLPRQIGALVRERYIPLVTAIQLLPIPVLAAVNGVAAGAGFALALAADLRVAADDAWFTCGFAAIGLVPDSGASYFLPRYLGLSKALQLALTSERLSAPKAAELGLLARVFPAASFHRDSLAFAQELASGPTKAFALTKQAFREGLGFNLGAQLELEADLQQQASETADFREGLLAFRQKRPPRFTGH